MIYEISDEEFEPLMAFSSPFFLVTAFTVICFQLHSQNPALFAIETVRNIPFPIETEWTIFALDQVVRAVFLDVFETLYWHITPIKYADHLPLNLFVLVFKTILTFAFWSTIVSVYREWFFVQNKVQELRDAGHDF